MGPEPARRSVLLRLVAVAVFVCAGCSGTARKAEAAGGARALVLRPKPAAGARFEGDFAARLRGADPARRFVALVDLTEQLDLRAFARGRRKTPAARAQIIEALDAVATRQQARLRPLLESLRGDGSISRVSGVSVVNRVIVEGTARALLALGESAEVAVVRPDWTSERGAACAAEPSVETGDPLGAAFRSWAVDAMKADRLWAEGIDGTGIVVASIDAGAFEAHEQLRDRRLPGDRGWFDPVEGSTVATDRHGHGTGVLSQAVGGNPGGRVVGLAPGARWASALGNWKNYYTRSLMTLAADWILRVARPDVLVNAWSHDEGECNDFDLPFIDAWKASGIFVVFPAGNSGPGRASGESPAQLRGIFPEGGPVFSVAALAMNGTPLPLSSRGPSRCGSRAFPSLAAPGAQLPVASLGMPNAYARGDGTSLSAGLAGGAAALLLQAAPETDPDTLERVLVESTRDVAPPGRDDATGSGAIDLEAALALLRAQRQR